MQRRQFLGTTAVLGVALAGCGGSDGGAPAVAVGDGLPELGWEGYVNEAGQGLALDQAFRNYSTSDLKSGGRRYALVHLSESF